MNLDDTDHDTPLLYPPMPDNEFDYQSDYQIRNVSFLIKFSNFFMINVEQ